MTKMKLLLKKFFDVNFFFSNALVPIVVIVLYCHIFAYISSRFQLNGVNYFFFKKLGNYLSIVLAGTTLTFLALLRLNKGVKFNLSISNERLYPGDFFLLFLPLTPVAQYILGNQDILSSTELLYVLIVFVLFVSTCVFMIPALLGLIIQPRTLMILSLAFVYMIAAMPSISNYFNWFEIGALRKQLIIMGSIFLVIWLLYNFNQRKILYLFVVINFIVNNSAILFSQYGSTRASTDSFERNKLLLAVEKKMPVITPNIYLLVYDAYVPNETMLSYGIDNSAQENFLSEQGFKLYPRTYSIESATLNTMSKVLNASTQYYGDPRRGVSGDGITQNILKTLNYKTYGLFLSDFMFRGYGDSYDYSIPKDRLPAYLLLTKAIFLGEFRFNVEDTGYRKQTVEQFVEAKHSVFEEVSGHRVFIYMYSTKPGHSQNSGACLPDETNLFEERLAKANAEMQQDVNLIVKNDPGAIVIVAGDHGPYLTKNCYTTSKLYDISEISRVDIQDRFATFLAIRWPSSDFIKYDDITILQDLFPSVFAYLYGDPTILNSKIEPVILVPNSISGASVDAGIIHGGIDDGEPLFLSSE